VNTWGFDESIAEERLEALESGADRFKIRWQGAGEVVPRHVRGHDRLRARLERLGWKSVNCIQ
jgi:hypothetical protein